MSAAPTTSLLRACCDPLNAINWALDAGAASGQERAFLSDWRLGDFGEWPDYVNWVRKQGRRQSGLVLKALETGQ